jgi:general secretion pathway protein K
MANNHRLQRGSALLSALFIMTLVAIATTAMSVRLQQDIYRTRLTLATNKLYLASQAVTFWAMGVLEKNNKPSMTPVFYYPKNRQHDYPEVMTTGKLIDLQARFNVNELQTSDSDDDNQANPLIFYRLLGTVLKETPSRARQRIALATMQWVNEQAPGTGQDTTTSYYLKQKPPYSPSHQLMQSISELRLVEGVDESMFKTLEPYLTALPPPALVNINTASENVLMALSEHMDKSAVETIIKARGEDGIQNITAIQETLKQYDISIRQVTLESQYFLSISTVQTLDLELVHYTILKRVKKNDGKVSIHIVHDSLNAY